MKKPLLWKAGGLCLALALLLWTLWGNTALMVSHVTVPGSRLPPAFSGFRIAQVSDLHNAEFGAGNERLLGLLAESAPELIAITGDLVDAGHTDTETALAFVAEAVKIAPVYYVPGNHEAHLPQYAALKAGLEEAGAVVLEDRAAALWRDGEAITVAGLSDPAFAGAGELFGEAPAMVRAKLGRCWRGKGGIPSCFPTGRSCLTFTAAAGWIWCWRATPTAVSSVCPLRGGLSPRTRGFSPGTTQDFTPAAAPAWW